MKEEQKIALRISEVRQKLNELGGKADLTEDDQTEIDTLSKEYATLETRARALTIANADDEPNGIETGDESPEDRELRQMIDESSIGSIFQAAVDHRVTDGREAELQQHFNLAHNQIPLDLLDLETRAVTPAPADVGQNQQTIVPGVFPQSCAAFLGVDVPRVPVGEPVFPVLTQNATVHAPAENDAATETTGSFSADVLSPARLQASFFYSREDRARFAQMDSALRQNLSEALMDGLDKAILSGTNGLFTGTNLANHAASAETTYALYRSQLAYGRVDGRYAMTVQDLRIVMGSDTYAHCAGEFRSDNAGDRAAIEDLMNVSAGVKVSAHVPDAASNKQNAVIRLGMRRDMVAPVWEGVTIIPDEVTKAANGQIVVTAVMLHNVKILRADGFYKQETQHQ